MGKIRKISISILSFFLVLIALVFTNSVNASGYFSLDYENYDGSMAADAYAWNYVNSICDAPAKSVISGEEAINGWSFKTGSPSAGYYYSNGLYAIKPDALGISSGHWKFTFDVKLNNVVTLGFRFLEANTDVLYDEISYTTATNQLVSDSKDYGISENNGVYTIYMDLTPVEGKSNYAYFYAVFGEGGGHVVLDNLFVSPSTYDYTQETLYSFDFENWNGSDSIPVYLWNNTTLYSDAPTISITTDGINGKSLKWDLQSGVHSGGAGLLGMKGAGNDLSIAGEYYETSFKVKMTNIEYFAWTLMYVDNGDKLLTTVKITSDGQIATDQAACVEKLEDGSYLVRVQYPAVGSQFFGWFEASSNGDGVLMFDDYTRKKIQNISLDVPEAPIVPISYH